MVKGLLTLLYLAQIMLPGTMLRSITGRLGHTVGRRRVEQLGRILILEGTALVLLNIPFDLIFRTANGHLLEIVPLFPLYVLWILAYHLLDLGYVWYRRWELSVHNCQVLAEACACAVIGLAAQHFLHI